MSFDIPNKKTSKKHLHFFWVEEPHNPRQPTTTHTTDMAMRRSMFLLGRATTCSMAPSTTLIRPTQQQTPLFSSSLQQQSRSLTYNKEAMEEINKNRKLYRPPAAKDLIAMVEPIIVDSDTVMCCGGDAPELGHPQVFINLERPGKNACGYCGQTFIWRKHLKE